MTSCLIRVLILFIPEVDFVEKAWDGFTKGSFVSEIFYSTSIVVTSKRWSSLLAKVCLNKEDEKAEDSDLAREKEVEDEHLIRSGPCSIVIVGGY